MHPKADEIVETVQSDILAGRLPPGYLLRQEQLARGFRVSRTPVREALKRLDAAGLVALIPHRGARVRDLTVDDVRESYIVRAELEGLAAELAADLATSEQQKRLGEADKEYARLSTEFRRADADQRAEIFDEWNTANDLFHGIILEASGVGILGELVPRLRRPISREALIAPAEEADVDEFMRISTRQHRTLRDLIQTRTPASARAVMRDHVELAGAFAAKLLPHDDDTGGSIIRRMSDPFYLRGSERA
ncbi:MAG: GntR family transcriptional regulator [Actinomycetota bacterium]